jgi:hypothetical protein
MATDVSNDVIAFHELAAASLLDRGFVDRAEAPARLGAGDVEGKNTLHIYQTPRHLDPGTRPGCMI